MIEYHSGVFRGAFRPAHLLVDEQGLTVLRNQFGPVARSGDRVSVLTERPGWAGMAVYVDACPCEDEP